MKISNENYELRSRTPSSEGSGVGSSEVADLIKASIRNVPDFPKQGIQFKDITTALKDAKVLQLMTDTLYD